MRYLRLSIHVGTWEHSNLPGVSTHICILRVSANSNTLAFGNTGVDSVGRPESVDQDLEISESLAVTRLDGWAVTVCIDIKNGD
jgi:hypothetical protein